LDTLYNNIDYILFNTYASDTELCYDANRQHNERTKRLITSSYKLFINDYFNKTYLFESSEAVQETGYINGVIVEEEETEETTDLIVIDVDGTNSGKSRDGSQVSCEGRFSLEEYNQAYSMPELHVNMDGEFQGAPHSNVSDEILEFEFGEYEIEDPDLQHVDYCMDFSDERLDEYRIDDENFVFDGDYSCNGAPDQNFFTESSSFNDVYLQIADDQNMDKMFLVQVKSPRFSIASLSSLMSTSKSYAGQLRGGVELNNIQDSSLTSSLDSSLRSSSLTLYSSADKRHANQNEKRRDYNDVFDELSMQNFNIEEFMKNVNVSYISLHNWRCYFVFI
jgi:hypothetical protein